MSARPPYHPNSRIQQLVDFSNSLFPEVPTLVFYPHRIPPVYDGPLPVGIWSLYSHGAQHRESGWSGSVAGAGNTYLLRYLDSIYTTDAETLAEDERCNDIGFRLALALNSKDGTDGGFPGVVDTIDARIEKPEYVEYVRKYLGFHMLVRFEERYDTEWEDHE